MRVLVAGGTELDAGKTTFSVGLVERTGATGFKPRAGNDYWYSHDDVLAAAEEGALYGKDAARLAAVSGTDPTDINAIHRLWHPVPGHVGAILEQDGREFLLDRAGDTYVVNATTTLPDRVRAAFPLEDARRVESLQEANEVMERHYRPAQAALAERIEGSALAVVESYGDVARPLQDLSYDAVAVVDPGRVRIYDGDRYEKGCAVASGAPDAQSGRLEERVGDVTDLIDPVETRPLPPLTSEERSDPDAVADAYGEAYDAVLAAAGE